MSQSVKYTSNTITLLFHIQKGHNIIHSKCYKKNKPIVKPKPFKPNYVPSDPRPIPKPFNPNYVPSDPLPIPKPYTHPPIQRPIPKPFPL